MWPRTSPSIFYSIFSYSIAATLLLSDCCLPLVRRCAKLSLRSWRRPPLFWRLRLRVMGWPPLLECYWDEWVAARSASFMLWSTKDYGFIDRIDCIIDETSDWLSGASTLLCLLLISRSRSSTLRFMIISIEDRMYSIIWRPSDFLISFFFSCSRWPSWIWSSYIYNIVMKLRIKSKKEGWQAHEKLNQDDIIKYKISQRCLPPQ